MAYAATPPASLRVRAGRQPQLEAERGEKDDDADDDGDKDGSGGARVGARGATSYSCTHVC